MTLSELLDNEDFRAGRKWAKRDETPWVFRLGNRVIEMRYGNDGGWDFYVVWRSDLVDRWRLVEPEKE